MNCIITAGPTYEPLDRVRRLTNFSTGRLGVELANFLVDCGCVVTLLLGESAAWSGERKAQSLDRFSTGDDLLRRLAGLAGDKIDAVFHAAAVCDFAFGKVWETTASGERVELAVGKLPTRAGVLQAELTPTPKIIGRLREFFPRACIVGWKYEVDGDRRSVVKKAIEQARTCHTNACVANGPAYGEGFGLVTGLRRRHLPDRQALYLALLNLARKSPRAVRGTRQ